MLPRQSHDITMGRICYLDTKTSCNKQLHLSHKIQENLDNLDLLKVLKDPGGGEM